MVVGLFKRIEQNNEITQNISEYTDNASTVRLKFHVQHQDTCVVKNTNQGQQDIVYQACEISSITWLGHWLKCYGMIMNVGLFKRVKQNNNITQSKSVYTESVSTVRLRFHVEQQDTCVVKEHQSWTTGHRVLDMLS